MRTVTLPRRPGDRAWTAALALAAVGGLLVAWYLVATLARPEFPLCHPVVMVPRGWQAKVTQHLPLVGGAAAVVGGTSLAVRTASGRRRPLSVVTAALGVAVLGRVGLAGAVCGVGALVGPGTRWPSVAVPVAVGAVLVVGGWYAYERE